MRKGITLSNNKNTGGGGGSEVGTLQQVTDLGASTTHKLSIPAGTSDFHAVNLGQLNSALDNVELFEFVSELPITGTKRKIYLIASDSPEINNSYDEYIWTGIDAQHPTGYELVGSLSINPNLYVTYAEFEETERVWAAALNDLEFRKADRTELPTSLVKPFLASTFTSTDIQLNTKELTRNSETNIYDESNHQIVIPSANPTQAGAYPADHYKKVQGLKTPLIGETINKISLQRDTLNGGLAGNYFTTLILIENWYFRFDEIVLANGETMLNNVSTNMPYKVFKNTYTNNNSGLYLELEDSINTKTFVVFTSFYTTILPGNSHENTPAIPYIPLSFLNKNSSFSLKFAVTGLNQSIPNGTVFNLLSLLNLTTTVSSANGRLIGDYSISNLSTQNALLKLPNIAGNCNYKIEVRATGSIGGIVAARTFFAEIRRSDNSPTSFRTLYVPANADMGKIGYDFTTYTTGSTDPYITNGIKIVIDNPSTGSSDITLTGLELIITGNA